MYLQLVLLHFAVLFELMLQVGEVPVLLHIHIILLLQLNLQLLIFIHEGWPAGGVREGGVQMKPMYISLIPRPDKSELGMRLATPVNLAQYCMEI